MLLSAISELSHIVISRTILLLKIENAHERYVDVLIIILILQCFIGLPEHDLKSSRDISK